MSVAQSRIAGTFAYFGWTLALAIYATAIWYFPVPGIEKSYIVQLSINSTEHVQVDLGLFHSFGLPNDKDPLQFASSFIQNMHLENLPSHEYNKTLSALLILLESSAERCFKDLTLLRAAGVTLLGRLFLVFPVFFNPRHRYAIWRVLMAAVGTITGVWASWQLVPQCLPHYARNRSLTTPDSLTINLGTGTYFCDKRRCSWHVSQVRHYRNGVFVVLVVVAAFLRDGRIFTTTKDRGDDPSDTELRPPPAYGTSEGNLLDQAKADKPNVVTG
ncbi:hypothetical protein EDB80DRAFT_776377 [Ilyonectria destructans]|nr:hypothetical protein EDB80DRAFT_776377 [Ilyonectria destructans]